MTPASKNPRVLCTLGFVFLAGAAVGALSMRLGLHDKLHRSVAAASIPGLHSGSGQQSGSPKTSEGNSAADAWLRRYKSELNLTDEQAKAIAAIAADYRPYYKSLEDQLDDLRATGKSSIKQVLTEEQRKKFDQLTGEPLPPTK